MAKRATSRKLGQKLDRALFGLPTNRSKFMRTGRRNTVNDRNVKGEFVLRAGLTAAEMKELQTAIAKEWRGNPAHKRKLYRLGYEAAVKNPGDAAAALYAVERTTIFREAAVADLAGAREFFLAGYHDGLSEKTNPRGTKGEFQKCVEAVAAKGGAYDPRAVCASMERKKYGQKELTRRSIAARRNAVERNATGEFVFHVPLTAAEMKEVQDTVGEEWRGNPASVSVDGRAIFVGSTQEAVALASRLKSEGHRNVRVARALKGAPRGWRKNWPWSKRSYSAASGEWSRAGDKEAEQRRRKAVERERLASHKEKLHMGWSTIESRREQRKAIARERKEIARDRAAQRKTEVRERQRERKALASERAAERRAEMRERARERAQLRAARREEERNERRAERYLKRGNPRNPLDTAQDAYGHFHGEKAHGQVLVEEKSHFHTHVWELGRLVLLRVVLPSDRRQQGLKNTVDIEFDYEGKSPTRLTANEKGTQLFIDGGNQSVEVAVFGIDTVHERELLGYLRDIWYYTDKKHLGKEGGLAIYKHKLGEEGGELPALVYRTLDKRLEIVGGSYTIPDEGVRN